MADHDSLVIGARAIARDIFKDALNEKQIYRLYEQGGWPFLKVLNKLAMKPSAARAEIERREQAARTVPEKKSRGRGSP
jgi:hypothetical protein